MKGRARPSRQQSPRGAPPEPAARPGAGAGWHADAAIVAALVLAWTLGAAAVTRGVPTVAYDTFRDMAYAENILAGRPWSDPSLVGYAWWYPPGNPLLFAGLSLLLGRPVVDIYTSSIAWLNVLNPVILYLLVRAVWRSRAAGLLALGMAGLGSYWGLTHALAPMPSVQGIALNLATLMLWHRAQRDGWPWTAATGAMIGASAWHHAMCGMFLLAAIGGHGLLSMVRPSAEVPERTSILRRAAVACGIGFALALPLLWHMLAPARINMAPFQWFGPELHDLRYALHAHAPLVLPLGLIGLWQLLRAMPSAGWVVGYAAAGVAGQLVGYLGHDLGLPIPYTIPHEFQWHGQLAIAIAAAAGVVGLSDRIAAASRDVRARRRRRAIAIALLASASLAPAIPHLDRADDVLMRLDAGWETTLRTCRWIRDHLPIDTVIASRPDAGYYMNGLTGRKVVALPSGHMNPASDAGARLRDLQTMLTTREPERFAPVAARYGVSHLLVVPRTTNVAAARELYARWSILELIDLGDVDFLFYRVTLPGAPDGAAPP